MKKTNKKELQKNKGITLVALVVTIVVLLILAGVSLNLVLGNNGIITKAKDSKDMSRAGSVEDEVALWKTDSYLGKETGGTTVSSDTMLQGLLDKKLVYEEEIDRENEIITIMKKDGTVIKEISYSDEDSSLLLYYVANINADEYNTDIGLVEENNDEPEPTTFEKAYIVYNDEKIDISSLIENDSGYDYIEAFDVAIYLKEENIIGNAWDLENTIQTFKLEKNGYTYTGEINMGGFPT